MKTSRPSASPQRTCGIRLDVLEDRCLLSASVLGVDLIGSQVPFVPPGLADGQPAHVAVAQPGNASRAETPDNGLGRYVREWTHSGIVGRPLAERIHELQDRVPQNPPGSGGNGPPVVQLPPGPGDNGPVIQVPPGNGGPNTPDPVDNNPGNGNAVEPGQGTPRAERPTDPAQPNRNTRAETPVVAPQVSRPSAAPTLSPTTAESVSFTPTVQLPPTAATGQAPVLVARLDAPPVQGALGFLGASIENMEAEQAERAPSGNLNAGLDAAPMPADLDAAFAGLLAEAATEQALPLEEGLILDLPGSLVADPNAFARTFSTVADFVGGEAARGWAPWLAAAALAAGACEIARRQLKSPEEDRADLDTPPPGWLPDAPPRD